MTLLSLGPEAGAEGPHDNTWQGAVPSSALLFFFSLEKKKRRAVRGLKENQNKRLLKER